MEKKIKMTLRIDYKAMKYYNMYNLIYRRRFNLFYIGLAVLCFAGAVLNFIGYIPGINKEPSPLYGVLFLIFVGYFVYQIANLEKIIDRNISQYFYNRNPIEQIMEISEENITITSKSDPTKVVVYEWIHVTNIHEINQYYYLFLGKQPLIISKDPADIIEGTEEILKEIIDEKIKLKPYKKVEKEVVKTPITYVHQIFEEEVKQAEPAEVVEDAKEVEYTEVENTSEVENDEDVIEIPVEVENKDIEE